MSSKDVHNDIELLVEQKILEFFGDPDSGLELQEGYKKQLRKRIGSQQKLTANGDVLKRYGISAVE